MKKVFIMVMLVAIAMVIACSKKHSDLPTSFKYKDALPAPYNVEVVGGREVATIKWSFDPDKIEYVKEFRVYQYIATYDMLQLVGTTSDTSYVDSFLVGNLLYCYKVSAVDSSDFEGWRSDEECGFVLSSK